MEKACGRSKTSMPLTDSDSLNRQGAWPFPMPPTPTTRIRRNPAVAVRALITPGLNESALNRMRSLAVALPADHPSVGRTSRCGNLLALLRESGRAIDDDEVADFLWNMPRFPILGLVLLNPDID